MIGFKLIPGLKRRFSDVVNIYELRGINFNKNALKDKLIGYIPVMSVLLEDSLEGSFEIGEAAYVRGFYVIKKQYMTCPKFTKRMQR
jgi:energy-coupling factor transport system permease protein